MTLGETLALMRDLKGLTLRDLSHLSGISNPLISQIETGKIKNPSFQTMIKICDGLGLDIAEIANVVRWNESDQSK